jgi:hypothetical protein
VPIVFACFAGFEGEYLLYLTEKRAKQAERGGAKPAAPTLDDGGSFVQGS